MPHTRIYRVDEYHDETEELIESYLIRAPNQSRAIRHVAQPRFHCEVATQDDLVELTAKNVKVQDAKPLDEGDE